MRDVLASPVRLALVDAADMPSGWLKEEWHVPTITAHPARMRLWSMDSRWRIRFVIAHSDGRLVGVLPVGNIQVPRMPDPRYDPALLLGLEPADARSWLLLGGGRDAAGGAAVVSSVSDESRTIVITALVKEALRLARAESLRGVALYIAHEQIDAFRSAFQHPLVTSIGNDAFLDLAFSSTADYLASLPSPRRNRIRRDWRSFSELGLSSEWVPATDILSEAAPLIAAVRHNHGVPDDPRLVKLRLLQWISSGYGEFPAVAIRGLQRELIGASFVCVADSSAEVYEVGLADSDEFRLQAYLEACYYAPIKRAIREGWRKIELGIEATQAKRLRGARIHPVWAVTGY